MHSEHSGVMAMHHQWVGVGVTYWAYLLHAFGCAAYILCACRLALAASTF